MNEVAEFGACLDLDPAALQASMYLLLFLTPSSFSYVLLSLLIEFDDMVSCIDRLSSKDVKHSSGLGVLV